jgi:hypothetical protein
MEDTAMDSTQEAPTMSFGQRLSGIFFEPTKTFMDIDRKATWIGIFLIMAILGMVLAYSMMSHMDTEALMRQQMAARNMSEEQINQAVAAQQQSSIMRNLKYLGVIIAPIAQTVSYLVMAGVFLLVFVLMGTPLTFKKTLSVTIWGTSPAGIVMSILTIALIYIKNPETIDMTQGVVMSNLGPLVNSKTNPVLASLLGSLDIFSLWSIVMLSIGFAAISRKKLTPKKAAVGVVILWVVFVLGKAGWRAIFPQ